MARLVLVTGDKGGVGKSFTARALLDWYMRQQHLVQAFDTDKTNSTLFRFYSAADTVLHLDVDQPSDLDELLNRLAVSSNVTGDPVLLVDCAARTMDALMKWMQDIDFLSLKSELCFQITLAFVLGPEKDCVSILRDVANYFQGSAEYVIIKNLAKGSRFEQYDQSATRSTLLETLHAKEIELPALLEKTTLLLDRYNLSFENALTHDGIQIADRNRIRIFRSRVESRLKESAGLWM